VRAYVFTEELHDITPSLQDERVAGIKLRDDDQIVSMYEENQTPHFLYYEKGDTRLHLFSITSSAGGGKKRTKAEREALKKEAALQGVTTRELKEQVKDAKEPSLLLTRLDKFQLNPRAQLEA
jgi:hypothetical protein